MSDIIEYFFLALDGFLHPDRTVYRVITEGGNPEIIDGLQVLTLIGIFLCFGGLLRTSSSFRNFPKRPFWAIIVFLFLTVAVMGRPVLSLITTMYWGFSVLVGKLIFAIGTFRMGVWGSRNVLPCIGILIAALAVSTVLNRMELGILPSLALLGVTVYSTIGVLSNGLPINRPVFAGLVLILSVGGIFESKMLAYPTQSQQHWIKLAIRYAGSFLLRHVFPISFVVGLLAGFTNAEIARAVAQRTAPTDH